MNLREAIQSYYREKQIERIIRIDMGIHRRRTEEGGVFSRDSLIRLALTFLSLAIVTGTVGAVIRPLHLPYAAGAVIGLISLIVAVEIADTIWLKNIQRFDRFFGRTLPIIAVGFALLAFLIFGVGKNSTGPAATRAFENWRSRVNIGLKKPLPMNTLPTSGDNWFLVSEASALTPSTHAEVDAICRAVPGGRMILPGDFPNLSPPLRLPRTNYFWFGDGSAQQVGPTQVTAPIVRVSTDEDSRHYGLCWKEPVK